MDEKASNRRLVAELCTVAGTCCPLAEKSLLQKIPFLLFDISTRLLLLLKTMGIGDPWAEGLNMGLDHSWGSGMSSLVAF